MKKRIKRIKPNKKGSSLILVLVTLSIVSIFAAITLLASFGGYIVKHKDTRSDKNFYTLEERLDQVYMFIGVTANKIFVDQYQHIRNELSNLQPEEISDKYLEYCRNAFVNCDEFRNLSYYCAEAKDTDGFKFTIGPVGPDAGNDRRFVFKDVHLEYTSGVAQSQSPAGEVDTFNSITTDIVITIPEINLASQMDYDAKHEYIYITDGSITLKGDSSSAHRAVGNIYCGNSMMFGSRGTRVTLNSNYLTVYNTLLVKAGTLDIYGSSRTSEIWARDIAIDKISDGAALTVIGNIFVADDLEINGKNSAVTLFGRYTGFGRNGSNKGQNDSAIAVNGQGTTLDLSGINRLIIGGNAYFPFAYSDSTPASDPEHGKTGEALALLVNENLYQVYSGYVDQASKKVQAPGIVNATFSQISKDGKTLQQYLDDGYTLVSTGVDITGSAPDGLGYAGGQFKNDYLSSEAVPIKLATYESKGYKYCYLYWDFVDDVKKQEFASECIEKGFEEKFLTNFLDLGQVLVNDGAQIFSETDLYAYVPESDAYKAVLAKANPDKTVLSGALTLGDGSTIDIISYLSNKKNQFTQYNASLAPVPNVNDDSAATIDAVPVTLENGHTKLIQKYIDEATALTKTTTYLPEGKLLFVDGDLKISGGNVTVTDPVSGTTKASDTATVRSNISKMNGVGLIITKGSFVSDSSALGDFKGLIISYKGIDITGGSYVYDSKAIVNAIRTTKSDSYSSDWGDLFTEEFYKDYTTGGMDETSFKITDVMAYENWMKNKNV